MLLHLERHLRRVCPGFDLSAYIREIQIFGAVFLILYEYLHKCGATQRHLRCHLDLSERTVMAAQREASQSAEYFMWRERELTQGALFTLTRKEKQEWRMASTHSPPLHYT